MGANGDCTHPMLGIQLLRPARNGARTFSGGSFEITGF